MKVMLTTFIISMYGPEVIIVYKVDFGSLMSLDWVNKNSPTRPLESQTSLAYSSFQPPFYRAIMISTVIELSNCSSHTLLA